MTNLDLTNAAEVKALKGWGTNSTRETWIDAAITSVSKRFESALCGRLLFKEERTEYFPISKNEGQLFGLAGFPVDSGEDFNVWNDPNRDYPSSSILPSASYGVTDSSGVLAVDGTGLDWGVSALKVTYTGGLAANAADVISNYPDISNAIAYQVAFEYESRNRLGQSSVQGPDGNVAVFAPHDWLPMVKDVIARYRIKEAH